MENLKKLAKIAWNGGELYTRPFKKNFKNDSTKWKDEDSFQIKFGYGHEEWMLSPLTRKGEIQFSFIQAFRNSGYDDSESKNCLLGKKIDLTLITCNPNNSQWYFIGEIRNLELLSLKDQENKLRDDVQNGIVDKFILDVQGIEANPINLIALKNQSAFNAPTSNVKFDLRDAFIQKDYIPLDPKKMKYKHDSTLYNFDLPISTLFEYWKISLKTSQSDITVTRSVMDAKS